MTTTAGRRPSDRHRQADGVRVPGRRRGRRDPQRGARRDGRQARLLPRPGRRTARARRRSWPSAPAPASPTPASGSTPRPPAATSTYDPATRRLHAAARARASRSPTRTARRSCPASSRSRSAPCTTPPQHPRGRAQRRRRRLARARHRRARRAASASSARATTRTWSPSGSRRSTASSTKLERGAHGRRRRLRARRLDDPDGAGLPGLDLRRLGLPRRVDRDRPRAGRRGRGRRPRRASRSPRPAGSRGTGFDLVTMFDCLHDMGDPVGAARHVRERARRRRHLDDRRADGRRPRRGQPQPGRPRLLRLLDAAVHAVVAVAGRRARARHPGRPGADPRRRDRRRLHPLPAASPRRRSTRSSRSGPDATASQVDTDDRPDGGGWRMAARRRAGQAPTPASDRSGTVERDGVEIAYDVYDADRPDRAADADLVDRRLAVWKARSPTWPGTSGWSPSTAGAAGRSGRPRGRGGVHRRASTPPTRVAVLDATGTDRAVLVGVLVRGGLVGARRRRAPRPGQRARRDRARRAGCRSPSPAREQFAVGRAARHHRGLGEVQRALLARGRLRRLRRGSSSSRCSTSRTRPSRSRTASAGRCETSRRRRWPTPPPGGSGCDGAVLRPLEPLCAQVHVPGARDPRHRGPGPAGRDRASGSPSSPAATWCCSRAAATARTRATRCASTT